MLADKYSGAYTDPDKYTKIRVTLPVCITLANLPEGVTPEHIASVLHEDTYEDGRRSFPVEMIEAAMRQMVDRAVRAAVIQRLYKLFGGGEMVEVHPGHYTNRTILEANEQCKNLGVAGVSLAAEYIDVQEEDRL